MEKSFFTPHDFVVSRWARSEGSPRECVVPPSVSVLDCPTATSSTWCSWSTPSLSTGAAAILSVDQRKGFWCASALSSCHARRASGSIPKCSMSEYSILSGITRADIRHEPYAHAVVGGCLRRVPRSIPEGLFEIRQRTDWVSRGRCALHRYRIAADRLQPAKAISKSTTSRAAIRVADIGS